MSDSLWPHGLQHSRPPCLSPTLLPVYHQLLESTQLIHWVGDAIQPSHPLSSSSPPPPMPSILFFIYLKIFFLFVVDFVIHWNETAMGLHVFPIPIPPPTSLSTPLPLGLSGSFPMSQFFPSGGRSIGVSASISVLPMNIQDWFPLGWAGWISLLSKELSRVFFNTTIQKHQFFGTQLSL